jgi:hypothetical protein
LSETSPSVFSHVIGILFSLFLLNLAFVYFGFKPYLYCSTHDLLWDLYQPFQTLICLAGFTMFMVGLFTRKLRRAVTGFLIMFGAYILPLWGSTLFSLGKGCGA